LDALLGTRLGLHRLQELGAQLGSDVPFFLMGGTAWGRGRGEKVTALPPLVGTHMVLVKPAEGLSTPSVFRCGKASMTEGARAEAFAGKAKDPLSLASVLFNGLEPAAFSLLPGIEAIKEGLLEAGALGALVSGSGPTVFGVADGEMQAQQIAGKMKAPGRTVLMVRTLSTGVEVL
jgi:4-diphosphocytidyl-2-C-methyl-D-erythritol kinase